MAASRCPPRRAARREDLAEPGCMMSAKVDTSAHKLKYRTHARNASLSAMARHEDGVETGATAVSSIARSW